MPILVRMLLVLALCAAPLSPFERVSAKGPVDRVSVAGPGLAQPVEITDSSFLAMFDPWGRKFIAWDRGLVTAPPSEAAYVISFHLDAIGSSSPMYTLHYVPCASDRPGYIYIPGRGEPEYRVNIGTINGASSSDGWDPTGKWQYATADWDSRLSQELATHSVPAPSDAGNAPVSVTPAVPQALPLVAGALFLAAAAIVLGRLTPSSRAP